MRTTITLTTILLLAAAACGQEAAKYRLQQKYTPGDYVVTMKSDMDNLTQVGTGMSISQKILMMMVTQMTVGKPEAKGQKIEITYKRIKQAVTGGPIPIHYDSADPAARQNQMLAPIYGAILDTKLSFRVSPDGKISDASGIEEMWDGVAAAVPGGGGAMIESMKDQFGGKVLEQMVDQGKMFLPQGPVAKGESWKTSQDQQAPMIGSMKLKHECQLADVTETAKGKVAIIKFTGTGTSDQPASAPAESPIPMKISAMDLKQSGTASMDLELGMITDLDLDQKLAMAMEMAPPQGEGEPMRMSMTQQGKMTVETRPGKYVPPATQPASAVATMPAEQANDADF